MIFFLKKSGDNYVCHLIDTKYQILRKLHTTYAYMLYPLNKRLRKSVNLIKLIFTGVHGTQFIEFTIKYPFNSNTHLNFKLETIS